MITVNAILEQKGRDVWTVTPETTVLDSLRIMAEKGVGALLVVDRDRILGIISERDYARKIILMGKTSMETLVREIMSEPIYCAQPETTAEECMVLMTEKRIRHLPVMRKQDLVGLVSIGDIVKTIISDQRMTIGHLENYIAGKYL